MKNFEFENNLFVNHSNKTIEITKQMNTAVRNIRSDAAKYLEEARAMNPGYRIVVKETRKGGSQKGLTYKYMESYIKKHGSDALMQEFNILRGKVALEEQDEFTPTIVASYLDVRDWFMKKFPEIEEYRKNAQRAIMDILNAA